MFNGLHLQSFGKLRECLIYCAVVSGIIQPNRFSVTAVIGSSDENDVAVVRICRMM